MSEKSKRRKVVEGDSLSQIALEEYGDANAWKLIAKKNNISDPNKLKPGTILVIPSLDEADGDKPAHM